MNQRHWTWIIERLSTNVDVYETGFFYIGANALQFKVANLWFGYDLWSQYDFWFCQRYGNRSTNCWLKLLKEKQPKRVNRTIFLTNGQRKRFKSGGWWESKPRSTWGLYYYFDFFRHFDFFFLFFLASMWQNKEKTISTWVKFVKNPRERGVQFLDFQVHNLQVSHL